MAGLEWNSICAICALSGAGKSTIANLCRNYAANTEKEAIILSWNFEMLAHKQIARQIVNEHKIPLRDLYSADEPLSDTYINHIETNVGNSMKRDHFYFGENPSTY